VYNLYHASFAMGGHLSAHGLDVESMEASSEGNAADEQAASPILPKPYPLFTAYSNNCAELRTKVIVCEVHSFLDRVS
jgi:hypothetical protein